jgi:hypothetical protein
MDNQFITKEMFLNLGGCIAIVCALTQFSKDAFDFSPLWVNAIFSFFVASVRLILIGDFSASAVLLGILNTIPLTMGAGGAFDVLKRTGILK